MKKFNLLCRVFLVVAITATSVAGQSVLKIGYINSQVIIAEDPTAIAAQEQFRREMVPWESELQGLEQEIAELINQYQAQQATLTASTRRAREEEIVQKQQALQERMVQIETQAATRQQELVQPIMERINAIIEEIRDVGNYTFIFDSSGGGLIAADESFDLTDEVLARLAAGGR
jgi:outer membrane protein